MPDHRYEFIRPDGSKGTTILTNFYGDAQAGIKHMLEEMPTVWGKHKLKHLASAPMGTLPQHAKMPDQGGPQLDPRLAKVMTGPDPKAITPDYPDADKAEESKA